MNFLIDLIEFNMEVPYTLVFMIIALSIVFLWVSLVIWVWSDSKTYFRSNVFRFFFAFTTFLFGFVGLLVYLLFKYLKIESDQEGLESAALDVVICPSCNSVNSTESRFCRNCGSHLQKKCKSCNRYVSINDYFCSDCGAPLKKNRNDKFSENKVENFAQLGYIKDVFSKASASLRTFFQSRKSKEP